MTYASPPQPESVRPVGVNSTPLASQEKSRVPINPSRFSKLEPVLRMWANGTPPYELR